MDKSLFVYGTLMHPEIRNALLGKRLGFRPAKLYGYAAYTFYKDGSESEYPILKPEEDAVLNGYVLEQVSMKDFEILRFYEGEEYLLKEVNVRVDDINVRAHIFMTSNQHIFRHGNKWNPENFVENHLQYYLDTIIPQVLSQIR